MLTPQEVSQHAFAKASFGGYNMAMVDEFLDALTEDYTTLYKENQVLKSKMKVLVDKVEEYRATDDSMRKAFLVAQKSAEDIVAKAEVERETLIRAAEDEARARIAGMRGEMENEQARLAAAQEATAAYIARLREICQHELAYLDSLPQVTAPAPTRTEKAAHEIEHAMQKLAADVPAPTPAPAPAPEEDEEPTVDLDRELEELRVPVADEDEEDGAELLRPGMTRSEGGLYAELLELNITRKEPDDHRPRRLLEESEAEPDEEDDTARRAKFDNLQFGKDYEIR